MSWNDEIHGICDRDVFETMTQNMKKVNDHYWKVGRTHFPRKMKAFYVNIILKEENDGKRKHIMGPYSKKTADSIMTDYLAKGECCWVEEDWIR
jgi:hypothetical protein